VNTIELLNVVNYQTCKVEINLSSEDLDLPADPGLSLFLHLQYDDACRKSCKLLHHFFSNFEVIDDSGLYIDGPINLYYPFFTQQFTALIQMKLQGFNEKVGGAPDCTLKKFTREVKTVLSNSPLLEAATIKIKPVANMIDNFSSQIQCIACKSQPTP